MAVVCQTVMALLVASSALLPEALASDPNVNTTTDTSTSMSTETDTTTTVSSTTASSTSISSRSNATATETSTSTVTRTSGFACLGNRSAFDADYGPCLTYHPTVEYDGDYNFLYCDVDFDNATGLSASQVCPECSLCSTDCLGDASAYDAGYGNCSSYAEELDYNWEYCTEDYDNVSGLFAFEACPECQSCVLPATEIYTSTEEAMSTTSRGMATGAPPGASTQLATEAPGTTTAPAVTPGTATAPATTVSATPAQGPGDEASDTRQGSGVGRCLLPLVLIFSVALARP